FTSGEACCFTNANSSTASIRFIDTCALARVQFPATALNFTTSSLYPVVVLYPGLLSEEYDSEQACLLGNFPQAFSHIGLIISAFVLSASTDEIRKRFD